MTLDAQIQLAPMPEPVSNNAVTVAYVDGQPYVYSFAGIDTSKIWSGIHNKAFRYSVAADQWEAIDPLPSPEGRIAAAASTVKNKIYIIGGYRVFSSGNEISLNKVHRYDPVMNAYMFDGAPVPIPIDDHVQAVWRDSLIYVITGWSNNGNVNNVQIYNPVADAWLAGTPLPPGDDNYKVFGASGVIVGDTIYYAGGATDDCCSPAFPPIAYFRKGIIDPADPTQIDWSGFAAPEAQGYRMGATTHGDFALWFGGSALTYNYAGIDYNGSGGVEPMDRWLSYQTQWQEFEVNEDQGIAVMDLRGVAKLQDGMYILAGGMTAGQQVTDQTLLVEVVQVSDTEATVAEKESVFYPNPSGGVFTLQEAGTYTVECRSVKGTVLRRLTLSAGDQIDCTDLPAGPYLLQLWQEGVLKSSERVIIQR